MRLTITSRYEGKTISINQYDISEHERFHFVSLRASSRRLLRVRQQRWVEMDPATSRRTTQTETSWSDGSRIVPPNDENEGGCWNHPHCSTWDLHPACLGHPESWWKPVQVDANTDGPDTTEERRRWAKAWWGGSTCVPSMRGHSQTSCALLSRHRVRSPRGQQVACHSRTRRSSATEAAGQVPVR